MMAVLHIVLALMAAGLVVDQFAASTAPLGYQDESGFHLGAEPSAQTDDTQSGNLG